MLNCLSDLLVEKLSRSMHHIIISMATGSSYTASANNNRLQMVHIIKHKFCTRNGLYIRREWLEI